MKEQIMTNSHICKPALPQKALKACRWCNVTAAAYVPGETRQEHSNPLSFVEPGLAFVGAAVACRRQPGTCRTRGDAGFGGA
jgi:hypothetical protein